ncbi:MAG TPA: DUF6795 domain-containing protein [Limnobacter sp.]|uniref:DUF6795 domain-containing protein n=1 Tax=Limnobacter sp. TaxID=2003368 RepID=UPI002E357E45|nr:DUF6795 domain-containing protein [Limnobacter sp.]HEX5487045.1 DUF6795 domain-containing protein [Limnobacter sp.]
MVRILVAFGLLVAGLFTWIQAQSETRSNLLLFSPVNGQLLDHGKPMAGQTIQRMYLWNMEKKPHYDNTLTDSQGRFHFDEIRGSAEYGFFAQLFNQPVILQDIYLLLPDKKIDFYFHSRQNHRNCEETGYPDIQITFDVSKTRFNGDAQAYFGDSEIKNIPLFERKEDCNY